MARNPTGVFSRGKGKDKKWFARLVYRDENGKKREFVRSADSQAHGAELRRELEATYRKDGGRVLFNSAKTFTDLADYYETEFLKPATYHEQTGEKIDGLRSYKTPLTQLNAFRNYFGRKKLSNINYESIRAYRDGRAKTISEITKRQLSIASVNRELALLRRMLNVATRMRWIDRNPFGDGEPLIQISKESKRMRILTQDEEKRFFDFVEYEHLSLIMIIALETGMRLSEIHRIKFGDFDLKNQKISNVVSYKGKKKTVRDVPLSNRLYDELYNYCREYDGKEYVSVFESLIISSSKKKLFGFASAKKAFNTARAKAGLSDVRMHDLRHTFASRLIRYGIAREEVTRILGHTQASTTYDYINIDDETLRRAVHALDRFANAKNGSDLRNDELIN